MVWAACMCCYRTPCLLTDFFLSLPYINSSWISYHRVWNFEWTSTSQTYALCYIWSYKMGGCDFQRLSYLCGCIVQTGSNYYVLLHFWPETSPHWSGNHTTNRQYGIKKSKTDNLPSPVVSTKHNFGFPTHLEAPFLHLPEKEIVLICRVDFAHNFR